MVWKNTIATDHTEGEPPSRGSTILVNIGSIRNNSAALRKMAATNVASSAPGDCRVALIELAGESAIVRVLALSHPRRDFGGARLLADPLLEVAQVLVHLLDGKAERAKMLQGVAGQDPHQAFAADGGDLGDVAFERGVGRIERRRGGMRHKRDGAAPQI